ncbi:hypothetical protein [Microtetraspora malaysiensis]|uniref:hypothetical protein n=1 Tax=Microtetraspora malaysiensis TaxID=161358 RepID=UPI00082F717B|nr:hypothetical protein [Microtetraspora malaysiensis]
MIDATGSAVPVPCDHEAGADRGAVAFAWLWIAGALLASVALALLATLPPLQTNADAVVEWVDDGTFQLTWAGEFLFFATIAWGTGAAGAFSARGTDAPLRRTIALVALSVTLIAFVIVLLALGRLVYPVVDMDLTADTIVLLASVVIGTVHLALLALAVVAFALPVPMRSAGARRTVMAVGITLGMLFVVGSYPWLLPMWLNLLVAGAVGCWGVLVGVAVLAQDRGHART